MAATEVAPTLLVGIRAKKPLIVDIWIEIKAGKHNHKNSEGEQLKPYFK